MIQHLKIVKIRVFIFLKLTFTGWNSFCPIKRKINLISALVNTTLVISSASTIQNELSNIPAILINNGYPEVVINTVTTRSEEMPSLSSLAIPVQCFDDVQNAK